MGTRNSVYQAPEYRRALETKGERIISITPSFFAFERTITLPLVGKRRILEARGTPSPQDVAAFKKIAEDYWYGLIAPVVLDSPNLDNLGLAKVTNHTILLDLTQKEDALWSNLEKKSIRWGIKTAEKNNLEFKEPRTPAEISAFYKLYSQTAHKGGFHAEPEVFMQALARTSISRLFIITKDNQIVAGALILLDKSYNYAILDLTSASEEGLKLQAMPFLYWNLIKFAKNEGYKTFDLGGYDSESKKGEKMQAINQFKERFGGNIAEQVLLATSSSYPRLRKLLSLFRFMRTWYRKE
jgi:hypothetical protein